MDPNPIAEEITGMQVLYKATMELYQQYFSMLETMMQNTPDSEVDKLNELHALAKEGEESLEEDLATFGKAISMDTETFNSMHDKLKIQDIYKKLKQ